MVFFLSYNFVTYLCCFFGANKLDFHRFFCYRIRRQFFKRISHSQLIYGHSSRRGPSAHVFFLPSIYLVSDSEAWLVGVLKATGLLGRYFLLCFTFGVRVCVRVC